ncbi:MAG: dTDP-glucose 4,6-dehydratase [Gammaproteobacteria bacterium]
MAGRSSLITGGAGFIGANFAHYWAAKHPRDQITVLDALTYAGNLLSLESLTGLPSYRFTQGDIRDQQLVESILRRNNIDTIVHFAAETHVDRSIVDPDAFIETNIVGTHSLLKAAKTVWLDDFRAPDTHRFHHVSTDEVYGSLTQDAPAFCEDTRYDPSSPYSASKASSDHLVRAYHRTYGLNVTISNCSNNYGPYQFPEKLIPLTILSALEGKRIPVYGDGSNIRDWLYIEDHCRGIELVLQQGKSGETYNIGGHNEQRNIDIVETICGTMDKTFETQPNLARRFPHSPAATQDKSASLIQFVTDRPAHDYRYAINPERILTHLGYSSQESFATGIEKTIAWYLNNESWWRAVMGGRYRQWISEQYALG